MSTQDEPRRYKTLDVTLLFDGDRVKVLWYVEGEASAREPYFVARRPLDDARQQIREALDALQTLDWSRVRYGRQAPVWPLRQLPDGIEDKMATLAEGGRAQYAALFTGLPGKEESDEYAEEFRLWFEENVARSVDPKWHLHFTHQDFSRSINPWGLTCSPGAALSDASAQNGVAALGFDNFWCSSLRLSCSTQASKQKAGEPAQAPRDIEVIGVFENDDGTLDRLINKHPQEADNAKRALSLSWKDVTQALRKMPKEPQDREDRFFYFSLSKDPDQPGAYRQSGATLSSEKFEQDVLGAVNVNKRPSFIFLDGDAIIRHDRGGKWVERALECGRTGLIAVETDIEVADLRHFGWNIARDLWLSRDDLVDSMQAARRKYWPLSLLYGLYSDPHMALIDPPPENSTRVIDLYIMALSEERRHG